MVTLLIYFTSDCRKYNKRRDLQTDGNKYLHKASIKTYWHNNKYITAQQFITYKRPQLQDMLPNIGTHTIPRDSLCVLGEKSVFSVRHSVLTELY